MAEDVKDMQRKLKEMELRAKMETKLEKKKLKDEKMKMKLQKRQEKMRRKLEKKGRAAPDDIGMDAGAKRRSGAGIDTGDKIVKAEVVEFTPKEWERRSVQSLDEIERKIDRFSGKGVKGLSERYREKYGEDLKVPELYQIESSLELDHSIEDLAREDEPEDLEKRTEAAEPKSTGGLFGSSKKVAKIDVGEPGEKPAPSFFDLSTGLMFLTKKYGSTGGGGKKIVMIIVDILLIPTLIIRIFTTPIFMRRRKKAQESAGVSHDSAKFADA